MEWNLPVFFPSGNENLNCFFPFNFSVVRNTKNPVYEEDFTFYGLTMIELQSMSLHFVVLSFDRYSRDDVIGEVVCPFNTIELHQIENQQVALSREIQPRSLKVKLNFDDCMKAQVWLDVSDFRSNHRDVENFLFRCAINQPLLDWQLFYWRQETCHEWMWQAWRIPMSKFIFSTTWVKFHDICIRFKVKFISTGTTNR